ncbi:MAG: hypothetical protein OXI33_07480 [Chloroflexota bacterium]|nr:hypothetical protein [Chloroflexota bacterium]
MAHDQHQNVAFLCVSYDLGPFLGFEKVRVAFPDIPSDSFKRIAYAARLDDTERTMLKDALDSYSEAESVIDRFFRNAFVREVSSYLCIEDRSKIVLREVNSFKAHRLYVQLKKTRVTGVDEWLKEIKNYYENDNQFMDFYTEGRYALRLQRSGLKVKMKPYNGGGPDLQVSAGLFSFDIEVTRFVGDIALENKMSLEEDETGCLIEMPDKSQDVWSKIAGKMKQLKEEKNGIILLHSDNIGIDFFEFEKNTYDISRFGEKLCAVIFVDDWTGSKVIQNVRAKVPDQELNPIIQRIVGSAGMAAYRWEDDLQRICSDYYHQCH